jgi:hypothetical protein
VRGCEVYPALVSGIALVDHGVFRRRPSLNVAPEQRKIALARLVNVKIMVTKNTIATDIHHGALIN